MTPPRSAGDLTAGPAVELPVATTRTVAALRTAADRDPDWVLRRIRQLTCDTTTAATPARVDALLMQAELTLRLGDAPAAVHTAGRARVAATLLARRQRQIRPLLTALAVHADLAVATGAPIAPDACAAWQAALDRTPRRPHPSLPAQALHAVAVYHHLDCRQGHSLLDRVRQTCRPKDPAAAMLAVGLAAMHEACHRPGRQRDGNGWQGRLPPVPGGALSPDLRHPDPGYLGSRILLGPGTHSCGARPF